jgi:hypothetical protein
MSALDASIYPSHIMRFTSVIWRCISGSTLKRVLRSSQNSRGGTPLSLAACCIFKPCSSVPVLKTTCRSGCRRREYLVKMSARTIEYRCPMCGSARTMRLLGRESMCKKQELLTSIWIEYRCRHIIWFETPSRNWVGLRRDRGYRMRYILQRINFLRRTVQSRSGDVSKQDIFVGPQREHDHWERSSGCA